MNRREALQRVALLCGGAVIGGQLFLEGCVRPSTQNIAALFEEDTIDLLGNIADTILPRTDTPGAKEAGVGSFMPVMVRDCYTEADQKIFLEGLDKLDKASQDAFGKDFQGLSKEQRTTLLTQVDQQRAEYQKQKKREDPNHYFQMLKQLSLLGYFTSELGTTKAFRYVPVPGRYDGNLPYKKGDKAFA